MELKNHITTYTGIRMDPAVAGPENFRIRDIAHALSLTCRGNGQVKTFFSVAQHCICCAKEAEARGLTDRVILACLLHDAAESYLSDVPSPLKKKMPHYVEVEDRILSVIYAKYLGGPLTGEEEAEVESVDKAMLYSDLVILLDEVPWPEKPEILVPPDYTVVPFEQVEEEYLMLFDKYYAAVHTELSDRASVPAGGTADQL